MAGGGGGGGRGGGGGGGGGEAVSEPDTRPWGLHGVSSGGLGCPEGLSSGAVEVWYFVQVNQVYYRAHDVISAGRGLRLSAIGDIRFHFYCPFDRVSRTSRLG